MRLIIVFTILLLVMVISAFKTPDITPYGVATLGNDNLVVQADHSYCGLYEDNDSGSTINLTTTGQYYQWATATAGTCYGVNYVSADTDNDRLVIGAAGTGNYSISLHLSFSGSANAVISCAVFKSGVRAGNISLKRKLSTTGDVGDASAHGIISVVPENYLDIRCSADGDSKIITIYRANIVMHRI